MFNDRYTIARKKLILDLLAQKGTMTNKEIAAAMGLSYRCIQPITQELESAGLITGHLNWFGRVFRNVSWRLAA